MLSNNAISPLATRTTPLLVRWGVVSFRSTRSVERKDVASMNYEEIFVPPIYPLLKNPSDSRIVGNQRVEPAVGYWRGHFHDQ